jgi:2,4-diketo-3-deoxy-L-fuconate hydrolase
MGIYVRYLIVIFALAIVSTGAGCHQRATEAEKSGQNNAPTQPESVNIAPWPEALTFARTDSQLILVTRYQAGAVEGVDVSALFGTYDPIELFNKVGYDAVRAAAEQSSTITVTSKKLGMPVDLSNRQIAAGFNYPAHADEVAVDGGPFLFPKMVAPTPPSSELSAGTALLDYEVELAFVLLKPVEINTSAPAQVGLILCNDFTDRDALLRHIDPMDVASGKGFAIGKSFPGYLPVGNLFVIPRDLQAFVNTIELQLFVNGTIRQSERASKALWGSQEMIKETWKRSDVTFQFEGDRVALPGATNGTIPARTMLMSGTPDGVIFQGISGGDKASGFFRWLFFGWNKSIPTHAIENYIERAQKESRYLQPGDIVTIHVDSMGMIQTRITP